MSSTNTLQPSSNEDANGGNKSNTVVRFAYSKKSSDFELMLEDNGVISICRLATLEPDFFNDLDFSNSPVVQMVILKSEWLQDAFEDIDSDGEIITFSILNSSPILKLVSQSSNGSTEVQTVADPEMQKRAQPVVKNQNIHQPGWFPSPPVQDIYRRHIVVRQLCVCASPARITFF
ncbi:Cell cycle checkpoint protein RAD1 [Smittium culicis]|uniref:Cell cycle checkpoint protein RAD1 n=1 Tax=Smittium culicis TaxID=133412 RepID=A0A1R1XPW8_9FUNG|nr:Cell cycle checkpoint protein RAD1 [Smittium culicis]